MLERIINGYKAHPAAKKAIDTLIAVSAGIILEALFGVAKGATDGADAVAASLGPLGQGRRGQWLT